MRAPLTWLFLMETGERLRAAGRCACAVGTVLLEYRIEAGTCLCGSVAQR